MAHRVGYQQRCTAVFHAISQLVRFPPRIEGHGHRACQQNAHEGKDELGVIAHGDGHTVALFNAQIIAQTMRHFAGNHEHLAKGVALIPINDEIIILELQGYHEQLAH